MFRLLEPLIIFQLLMAYKYFDANIILIPNLNPFVFTFCMNFLKIYELHKKKQVQVCDNIELTTSIDDGIV